MRYWLISDVILIVLCVLYSDMPTVNGISDIFHTAPHWYITQLLSFYVVFFLVFSLMKKGDAYRFPALWALVLAAMVIEYRKFGLDLYLSSGLGFAAGFFVAKYIRRIRSCG